MPLELTYAVGRLGAILFGHFDPEDADCTAAAAQSKVPIFFVHGDADGFVPYEMGKRISLGRPDKAAPGQAIL